MASTRLTPAPSLVKPLGYREARFIPAVLWIADAVTAQAALVFGYLTRELLSPLVTFNALRPENYRGIFLAVLALPVVNWCLGLYPGYGLAPVERLRRRVIGAGATFIVITIWDSFVLRGGWSRSVEVASCFFAIVFSPLVEAALISYLIRMRRWGTPVVVLSADHGGERLIENLRDQPELGLVPIAVVRTGPELMNGLEANFPTFGPGWLPTLSEVSRTAIVADAAHPRWQATEFLHSLPFPHVVLIPELPGIQSLWVTPRDLGGALGLELRRNLLLKRNYYIKRLIDYLVGIPLLLLSLPLIAAFALWIKLVSPGSAFYAQKRQGYRGRAIRIWKLRTMYPNAEELLDSYLTAHPAEQYQWQRFVKLKDDPRILPRVGAFLRRTSLDELPQLWNVVRNQMSLVGPRPFPLYHLDRFPPEFRDLRQSVPPGLTGFWQVSDRSDADLKRQEHLDTYYIRNWSLWLDVYILVRTAKALLKPRGAY